MRSSYDNYLLYLFLLDVLYHRVKPLSLQKSIGHHHSVFSDQETRKPLVELRVEVLSPAVGNDDRFRFERYLGLTQDHIVLRPLNNPYFLLGASRNDLACCHQLDGGHYVARVEDSALHDCVNVVQQMVARVIENHAHRR